MKSKGKDSDLDSEVEGDESLDEVRNYSDEHRNLKSGYGKNKKMMRKDKEEEGDYHHHHHVSTTTTIKASPKDHCFGPQEDYGDEHHDDGMQGEFVPKFSYASERDTSQVDIEASQGSKSSNNGVVSSSYKEEEDWSGDRVVHRLAQLYWKRVMTHEERKQVRKEMQTLGDHNGHGSINLADLLHASPKKQRRSITKLFNFLDIDGSGFLNLEQCITLHYLKETGYRICGSCSDPILNLGFACNTCWKLSTKNGGGTFDLCLLCYDSSNYTHPHHDFLDDRVMQIQASNAIASEDVATAKCIVCGHCHTKKHEGYLLQGKKNKHMLKLAIREIGREVDDYSYICEWCMIWPCNNCGKYFKSSFDQAKPKLFLTIDKHCDDCGKDGNLINTEPIIEGIKNNLDLRKSCQTCDTLIKNGDLFKTGSGTSQVWKNFGKSVRKTFGDSSIKMPSKPSWSMITTNSIKPKPKPKPQPKRNEK